MEYTLSIEAERSVVRESLKGIIWSIFFHRLFGPITPSTNDFFDITYPTASDMPDLDSLIDEKIDLLIRQEFSKDNRTNQTKYGVILVQFYDRKTSKSQKKGWFGKSESSEGLKIWESWIIQVKCLPISEAEKLSENALDPNITASILSFESCLLKIIEIADSHKDHIPPITSLDSSPFPYRINIDHKQEDESWGSYIKKILD